MLPLRTTALGCQRVPRSVSRSLSTLSHQKLATWQESLKKKAINETDEITSGHSHLVALTLDPSTPRDPFATFPAGHPLPSGYHFALFPPRIPESDLAPDGYDTEFSPPEPYIQRMWAGGSFEFVPDNPLRVGQTVKQTTRLDDVQIKQGPRGEAVLVWLEKVVENEHGRSLRERRCLAYMGKERNPTVGGRVVPIKTVAEFARTITPTIVTLFRYSAVTFNSHRIHYDNHYAKDQEGYPDCLTHGPLTATLLLDLLERHLANSGAKIKSFSYRTLSPLIVNDPVTFCGKKTAANQFELWAKNKQGGIAVKGSAEVS
ncbi:uncharacterized protein SPPG_07504 [Spizellomyces punctatus DAOM BR117]|uniref:FAS1-like dehydratase domain-containing protein n=1 Tax=Spizellomyces punctatus (strain DAOM BR117) TaxID=645134 RepID=A0A0L0H855_SPIPD|nr:uncharacterized protein SPPG_07504 [Spizellomyces punctatus DAOM BR117]KNC97111.1 hypothetical protein SPPG_07504 [Spizellomyces punctatus DAOM BR117]|eukprot:XP_016605151.1 hypothetical protein SPPG_07504 [Spizellomyces punctatus DAOM BR117]